MDTRCWRGTVLAGFTLGILAPTPVPADELTDAMTLWQQTARWCEGPGWEGERFPTMILHSSDEIPPPPPGCRTEMRCQDGDSTMLPNALLCAAGEEAGCDAVRRALDSNGRWHRSPRYAAHPSCKDHDDFSPDMALGVQLYLVTKRDEEAAAAWWRYLDTLTKPFDISACPELHEEFKEGVSRIDDPLQRAFLGAALEAAIQGLATVSWPSFCKEKQLKCGCFMRPGDFATLFETEREMHLGVLPDGSKLRGMLGTFGGLAGVLTKWSAEHNDPGFSRHLAATTILLLRRMGHASEVYKDNLDAAAKALAKSEPENPFYRWLAEGRTDEVRRLTLKYCPTVGAEIKLHMAAQHPALTAPSAWWRSCDGYPDTSLDEHGKPRESGELGAHDYFLQRDMTKRPWCETALWECVVMGRLLGAN
jgi:hypothetical protein